MRLDELLPGSLGCWSPTKEIIYLSFNAHIEMCASLCIFMCIFNMYIYMYVYVYVVNFESSFFTRYKEKTKSIRKRLLRSKKLGRVR